MTMKSHWLTPIKDGIRVFTLDHWNDLTEMLNDLKPLSFNQNGFERYIFRGHSDPNWKLESTLARMLKGVDDPSSKAKTILANFKSAICGRRGSNPRPLDNDELWALGQHHGLATPLLDWTKSPYVALFFAMNGVKALALKQAKETLEKALGNDLSSDVSAAINKICGPDYCVIYALNQSVIRDSEPFLDNVESDQIEFIKPLTDDNQRLLAQGGLFTKTSIGESLEQKIARLYKGETKRVVLLEIRIPTKDRNQCLMRLNQMNINSATLFPDLTGAGYYCNEMFQLDQLGF